MLLTASSRLGLMTLCRCEGLGSAGSGIAEFRWSEALSTEPAVHRVEGSLDIYVGHLERFSEFSLQFSQKTQCQYGVDCRLLRVKPDCCGPR